MARSAWKFFNTNIEEIYLYLNEYSLLKKKQSKQIFGLASNSLQLNPINYMHRYVFHQGMTYVKRKFHVYSIRSTGYCFLKFTKPFWFRSKKKK